VVTSSHRVHVMRHDPELPGMACMLGRGTQMSCNFLYMLEYRNRKGSRLSAAQNKIVYVCSSNSRELSV
jgi:hypothetical protein